MPRRTHTDEESEAAEAHRPPQNTVRMEGSFKIRSITAMLGWAAYCCCSSVIVINIILTRHEFVKTRGTMQ